jgi:hypothetical protein
MKMKFSSEVVTERIPGEWGLVSARVTVYLSAGGDDYVVYRWDSGDVTDERLTDSEILHCRGNAEFAARLREVLDPPGDAG